MKYMNETSSPKEAPKGSGPSDMYSAPGLEAFIGEMTGIAYGKYGSAGCKSDKAKIAPYMMYNDKTDQNGY
jgi:hypothetical protein